MVFCIIDFSFYLCEGFNPPMFMVNVESKFVVDFSVDGFNELEFCNIIESDGVVTQEECESFIEKLVSDGVIEVNERSKGEVVVVNGMVYLDYETCTQLGEDWDDDEWETKYHEIQIVDLV